MSDRVPFVSRLALIAALVLAPLTAATATTFDITWLVPMTAVTIDAEVGDTVTWTGSVSHTVEHLTGLDGQDLDPVTDAATLCASLAGAVNVGVGGSAAVTFTQAGTFYYICAAAFPLHCNNGMRVRVNVTDSAVSAPGEVKQGAWGRVKATYR